MPELSRTVPDAPARALLRAIDGEPEVLARLRAGEQGTCVTEAEADRSSRDEASIGQAVPGFPRMARPPLDMAPSEAGARQQSWGGMAMHLGLIGGIGPAATEFYYRGLVDRHARADKPLELTIVHADVRELARNLANGDARRQAEIFARLVRRLAAAGAHAAAVTSMGGHFCIGELKAISPLPIVNAIPMVDAAIKERKLKTVGIIGTRTVMETRLYGGISSAAVVLPEGEALEEVHESYVDMAIAARATDAQRRTFFSVGRHLCQAQGAEAVVLGGTDLFLAFHGQDAGFSVIDCAEAHVEALHRWSTREATAG